jgi:transaldolase
MEIFVDTANTEHIKELWDAGLINGVTTNPSLVAKENRDYNEILKEICDTVDGPISAEVIATDKEGMLSEAREYAKLHKNIVVKIPLILDGIKAVKTLSDEGIKTNVTLCFSPLQALLSAKAGATYISPFIGRLDDIGHTGMDIIAEIKRIYDNYGFETKILVASVRHPNHILEAAMIGADTITIPYQVIKKMLNHPLTDIGIDRFLNDYKKLQDELNKQK